MGCFLLFKLSVMLLYFIRHPESENNLKGAGAILNDDSILTEGGLRQLESIVAHLKDV
jgi:broad specificity phosphatase PhoE